MSPPHESNSPALLAPGASSHNAYAPGRGERLPAVDDRLVAPESHAQVIDGRLIRTMGANPPHATHHMTVAHVFAGCLAEGYEGAVDMLLRADEDNDVAPDVSVFPSGVNPATGGRRLEEIAFEVLDTERMGHATEKAEKFIARGVRRVFCVRLSTRTVYEWRNDLPGWVPLAAGDEIVDRCFRVPIAAGALLDRVVADDNVAKALLASRNRVIERELAAREARGEARAVAASVLRVLARRGLSVDEATRARVLDCDDRATLDAWLDRAVTATSVDDALG